MGIGIPKQSDWVEKSQEIRKIENWKLVRSRNDVEVSHSPKMYESACHCMLRLQILIAEHSNQYSPNLSSCKVIETKRTIQRRRTVEKSGGQVVMGLLK